MTSKTEGEMVERVARSIYEKRNGFGAVPWSRRDAAHKHPYLSDAYAAIEAMRAPTNSMLEFGLEALKQSQGELESIVRDADACYRAMLHEALK